MSDEDVQKAKMEKRKEFLDDRMKVEEMITEIEDTWGKRCRCKMPGHYLTKVNEVSGKKRKDNKKRRIYMPRTPLETPEEYEKVLEAERNRSNFLSEIDQLLEEAMKSFDTSKTSEESKITKKSTSPSSKPTETISEEKPRKAPEAPQPMSVTTPTKNDDVVIQKKEKKMVVEKKKKKKKNPCCSIC
ncbi:hypothetical protein GCK72_004547 [Caenorhabditis remanei]|uniref:Uncharacterized protein n=2 Tax=Caenorhabditis remanei TaxID=31234 RepID=A0A6A5HA17_CAERE|nr:hypothetical protein GCK72_004547 [Caenorhabditis remanei]KAF1764598.1 hypothetical protein GCK72_004547 [Caenorhabditis remanei]